MYLLLSDTHLIEIHIHDVHSAMCENTRNMSLIYNTFVVFTTEIFQPLIKVLKKNIAALFLNNFTLKMIHLTVDGGWSAWTTWLECSTTCGSGVKSRFRVCDSPRPQYSGAFCDGEFEENTNCTISPDLTNCTSKILQVCTCACNL